jgi:hypothetical protein
VSGEREPTWLIAMVDQKLALMEDILGAALHAQRDSEIADYAVILTPLTEPEEGSSAQEMARWERTCDNCSAFCPGLNFWTGHVVRDFHGRQVIFTFGTCSKCAGKEE